MGSAREAAALTPRSAAPTPGIYPVAEECFFRGAVFGALLKRSGSTAALWGSTLFFAVLHVQHDWRGMTLVLIDALFFGAVRSRTRSVLLTMVQPYRPFTSYGPTEFRTAAGRCDQSLDGAFLRCGCHVASQERMMPDRIAAETTPDNFGDLPIQPTGSGVADLEVAYERMRLAEDTDAADPVMDAGAADELPPL